MYFNIHWVFYRCGEEILADQKVLDILGAIPESDIPDSNASTGCALVEKSLILLVKKEDCWELRIWENEVWTVACTGTQKDLRDFVFVKYKNDTLACYVKNHMAECDSPHVGKK